MQHYLLISVVLASLLGQLSCSPLRVCYYAAWAIHDKPAIHPSDLDPALCSHIVVAFARLSADGTNIEPDKPEDIAVYANATALKQRNTNVKVILSVGGWNAGSDGFTQTVSSDTSRQTFATNAIAFLRSHNFDGVDVDWEYPGNILRGSEPSDKEKYARLLQVLSERFTADATGGKSKLQLSVAVSSAKNRTITSYDVRSIGRYVDFINMMMYDFHGEWEETVNVHSALYSKTDDLFIDALVKHWVAQGAPKDKIVLGMPFYGRSFSLADPAVNTIGALHTGGTYKPYSTICKEVKAYHLQERILEVERVPYIVYNGTWTGYDNMQSLREKAEYVRTNGYGGVMIWSVDMDDTTGACGMGAFPLLNALISGLTGHGTGIVG